MKRDYRKELEMLYPTHITSFTEKTNGILLDACIEMIQMLSIEKIQFGKQQREAGEHFLGIVTRFEISGQEAVMGIYNTNRRIWFGEEKLTALEFLKKNQHLLGTEKERLQIAFETPFLNGGEQHVYHLLSKELENKYTEQLNGWIKRNALIVNISLINREQEKHTFEFQFEQETFQINMYVTEEGEENEKLFVWELLEDKRNSSGASKQIAKLLKKRAHQTEEELLFPFLFIEEEGNYFADTWLEEALGLEVLRRFKKSKKYKMKKAFDQTFAAF